MKIKSDELTNIVKIITNLGDTFIIITGIIICFLLFRKKVYPILITSNILGVVLINQTLKHLIMRPRPDFLHLVEETGFSFPSGHSMAAFGFYGYFIYLINISKLNKKIKVILTSILSIIILLIGLSRVYLGVHYISDVVAGFIMSFIYILIFTTITKKYLKHE
jgi:undecaprenyl-diphosphatase